jgi:hypothetical protein
MSVIHAELMEKFYFGDDAVLLAMDGAGWMTSLRLHAMSHGPVSVGRSALVSRSFLDYRTG